MTTTAITESELEDVLHAGLGRHGALGAVAAIVQDGELSLVTGAGSRSADDGRGVGVDTVFPVASISKTFTAGALGVLVERGDVALEDRVRRHLPNLQFCDALRTEETTLLDLAAHRTGLPRHPLAEYESDLTSAELLAALRYVEPAVPFRSGYSYTNVTYLALGTALAQAAGTTYAKLLQETLLDPLGLRATTASFARAMEGDDLAEPHALADGRHVAVPRLDRTRHAPASVVHSSGHDLGRWLEAFAGTGAERLFGATRTQFSTPHSVSPTMVGGLDHAAVDMGPVWLTGLGWALWVYHGRLVLSHGGDVDGFKSDSVVVPSAGFACAVLANTSNSPLGSAVCGWALDRAFTGQSVDWSERVQPMAAAAVGAPPAVRLARRPVALEGLAGDYDHPAFGRLSLRPDGGDLVLDFARATRWPLRLIPTADGAWTVRNAGLATLDDWPLDEYAPQFSAAGSAQTVRLGSLGTWSRA